MIAVAFPFSRSYCNYKSDERRINRFELSIETFLVICAVLKVFKTIICKQLEEKETNGFQLYESKEEAEKYERFFLSDLFRTHSKICKA